MYRRFYHSKRRLILWAIVVLLAQGLVFLLAPVFATFSEHRIFGSAGVVPIFIPIYFAIGYGIVSRHKIMSILVGLLSGWAAPVILTLQGQYRPRSILLTIADGLFYALIGFLAAWITSLVTRKKGVS